MSVTDEEPHPPRLTGTINFNPQLAVTVPDTTDWHLVADHELDTLATPPAGIVGAIGFAALGASIGALPSGCTAIDKVSTGSPIPAENFRALIVVLLSFGVAVVSLMIFGYYKYVTKGVLTTIRSRPKMIGSSGEGSHNG